MTGARQLEVRLSGETIGHVTQTPQGSRTFRYTDDYAARASRTPLSLSMPVAPTRYSRRRIDPYMRGLLPDKEAVRERWGRQLGVSPENPFALLSVMGRECAGAVQFVELDTLSLGLDQSVELTEASIGQRLRDLRTDPAGWTVSGEQWSLPGAQGKFALALSTEGTWSQPRGQNSSTHILKPGIDGYPMQALNEHVCLSAARALGIAAAHTEYRDFNGEHALVVTRYDRRRAPDGQVVRIHQEDFCQALAVYPHRKYEANGGPRAATVAALLRSASSNPQADLDQFAHALVFNYLIGAPDAHAKNYSVLLGGLQVRLAPLYDVASALPYDAVGPTDTDKVAMSIGGKRVFGTVHGRHWDRLANDLGIDPDGLRAIVTRLAHEIPDALADALDPSDASELHRRLLKPVSQLCAATVTQLSR